MLPFLYLPPACPGVNLCLSQGPTHLQLLHRLWLKKRLNFCVPPAGMWYFLLWCELQSCPKYPCPLFLATLLQPTTEHFGRFGLTLINMSISYFLFLTLCLSRYIGFFACPVKDQDFNRSGILWPFFAPGFFITIPFLYPRLFFTLLPFLIYYSTLKICPLGSRGKPSRSDGNLLLCKQDYY
jgi:hypothetical protein